ncbi:MAG: hypothetical protein U5K54_04210 [Cytophagales bacterium]|nr:hypothetical protein [Cytophagales bacterium]
MYKIHERQNHVSIKTLVDYFGVQSFLGYAVGTYSSGMTKKLSLLLAFIGDTKLILLDEPLITLEDSFLPKLFTLIKRTQGTGHFIFVKFTSTFSGRSVCARWYIDGRKSNRSIHCMRDILHMMIKVLVIPFYKNHAGLLFFVFFLMFGIVESTQIVLYHTSLIYGMLSSGMFLVVVFVIWLLYQLKSLHFLLKISGSESHAFLNELALLPTAQSYLYFLLISFMTSLPVFLYTFGHLCHWHSTCIL